MTISRIFKAQGLVLMLFALISCGGQKPMVTDVKVSTSVVDQDVMVSLSADLSIGNLMLPNATIPILIPRTGQEIGTVTLLSGAGVNKLAIDLNVSETAQLDLEPARLPNGVMVPIIEDRQVIVVPLGKGAELYISIVGGQAALGVAIPIKTFDGMGRKVGTAALMPVFAVDDVIGSAGIFTSKEAGENGIALIADVSAYLGNLVQSNKVADHSRKTLRAASADSIAPQLSLAKPFEYKSVKPSRSKEKRINRELLKLHRRKKRLNI